MVTKIDARYPYPLPDSWKWVTLGEVHDIVTGSTPPKQCEEYYGGTIPFVKPPDLVQGGQLERTKEYLADAGARLIPAIPAHSTLLCCIGSVGKSAYSLVPVRTNQQINSLIPSEFVFPKFTYYYTLTPLFQQMLQKHASVTTIRIVNKNKLAKIPFPLPPFIEQLQLVEQLERDVAKLAKIEQLLLEAKEIGNQLRQSILDQTFATYLERTTDWKTELFGDLVEESKAGLTRKQVDQTNHYPYGYLKMNNITTSGEIVWDDLIKVQATEEEIAGYTLRGGDLLFNTRNSWELVGKNAVVTQIPLIPVLFNNNMMRIRFRDGIDPWFVHYYLQSPTGQDQLGRMKSATTSVAAIYERHLFQMPVPFPTHELQKRIVDDIQQTFHREREALRMLNESIHLQAVRESIIRMAFHQ